MKLTFEYANEWRDKLKNYWWNKNIDKATSLFEKTTFYQEIPFMK